MPAVDTIASLSAFEGRGAGSDAERRAALWLRDELDGGASGRRAHLEPFWSRPNREMAQAWHALLGLAGGLVCVYHATVGGAIVLVALVCVLADEATGRSPGRRLTRERASQNVVSAHGEPGDPDTDTATATATATATDASTATATATATDASTATDTATATATDASTDASTATDASTDAAAPDATPNPPDGRVRLILTANYDAGRMGLVHRNGPRRAAAALHRATGGRAPGWLAWLTVSLVWLLVIAFARMRGSQGALVGALQLPPTVALVLAVALLWELAGSSFGPAASDNASGAAVVIALARALEVAPPRALRVEVVLAGAGEGGAIGLRRFLRGRRRDLTPTDTIVLGIAACGAGSPRWWHSDGPLIPLAYHHRLRALCAGIAASEPHLGARAYRGRGMTPAFPGRRAGLPAIAIGCLDERELPPRSHQPADTAQAVERSAVDATLELALMLVDAIDAELTARPGTQASETATA